MRISEKGIDFIKNQETFRSIPYKNSDNEKYYSVGYGHYSQNIKETTKITEEVADTYLRYDIHKFEGRVAKYNECYNFTQNEFDALVSFCYQVGNIDKLTDFGRRSKSEIAKNMILYCSFCGKFDKNIMNRRKQEQQLFLGGINE